MAKQKNLLAGVVAGVVGGLAAAWMVNEFFAGLPPTVAKPSANEEPLDQNQKEKADPQVQYAIGAVTGGVYGGLAEYSPTVRSGFGTSFGGVLFSYADVLPVHAFSPAPSPADEPGSSRAIPFAAHVVYGITMELVRRVVRLIL